MVIEIEKGAKKEDASKANDAIPGLPRDPGIYYKSSQAARTQLKEVEAAKTEMQRGFATLVTGIGSLKYKAIFNGANAALQLEESRPTFYVRLYSPLITAIDVRGSVILKMDEKKKTHQVLLGSFNQTETKRGQRGFRTPRRHQAACK